MFEVVRFGFFMIWVYGMFGLIWFLNWFMFGVLFCVCDVVSSDVDYVRVFLTRFSVFWFVLFVFDFVVVCLFVLIGDYFVFVFGFDVVVVFVLSV